jgi:hypothetical protein
MSNFFAFCPTCGGNTYSGDYDDVPYFNRTGFRRRTWYCILCINDYPLGTQINIVPPPPHTKPIP